MDEGYLEAVQAAPRLGVYQRHALRGELSERGADVLDIKGDVMDAGPTLG